MGQFDNHLFLREDSILDQQQKQREGNAQQHAGIQAYYHCVFDCIQRPEYQEYYYSQGDALENSEDKEDFGVHGSSPLLAH